MAAEEVPWPDNEVLSGAEVGCAEEGRMELLEGGGVDGEVREALGIVVAGAEGDVPARLAVVTTPPLVMVLAILPVVVTVAANVVDPSVDATLVGTEDTVVMVLTVDGAVDAEVATDALIVENGTVAPVVLAGLVPTVLIRSVEKVPDEEVLTALVDLATLELLATELLGRLEAAELARLVRLLLLEEGVSAVVEDIADKVEMVSVV